MNEIEELCKALDALIHAYEDEIDDYETINERCEQAKALLVKLGHPYKRRDD